MYRSPVLLLLAPPLRTLASYFDYHFHLLYSSSHWERWKHCHPHFLPPPQKQKEKPAWPRLPLLDMASHQYHDLLTARADVVVPHKVDGVAARKPPPASPHLLFAVAADSPPRPRLQNHLGMLPCHPLRFLYVVVGAYEILPGGGVERASHWQWEYWWV